MSGLAAANRKLSSSGASSSSEAHSRRSHQYTPSGLVDFSKLQKKGHSAKGDRFVVAEAEIVGGEARDEYGFALHEEDDSLNERGNGGVKPQIRAQSRKTKKRRHIFAEKQNKLWDAYMETLGGDIMSLPELSRSRWRKYSGQNVHGSQIFTHEGEIPRSASASSSSDEGSKIAKSARSRSSSLVRFGAAIGGSVVRRVNKIRLDLGRTVNRKKGLTMLIRNYGIPHHRRGAVWIACSGANEKRKGSHPKRRYYEKLLKSVQEKPPPFAEVIERDLHRTFPTNYHFEDEEGITMLRNVLLAYSSRNVKVGYCQSMNFLVAMLLLHMDEEDAFWVLAAIVEDLVPGHYTSKMTGMHIDQRVFESLLAERLPRLDAHLKKYSVPLAPITYQWFLCLFVNTLPLECTLRVWDAFLHEGAKALFRVGISILKIYEKRILAENTFQDVYKAMRATDVCSNIESQRLMKICYGGVLAAFESKHIVELRDYHTPAVFDELSRQNQWKDYQKEKRAKSNSGAAAGAVPGDDSVAKEIDEGGSEKEVHLRRSKILKGKSTSESIPDSSVSLGQSPVLPKPRRLSKDFATRRLSLASDFQYSHPRDAARSEASRNSLIETVSSRILSGHWKAVSSHNSLRRSNSTGVIIVPDMDESIPPAHESLTPSSSGASLIKEERTDSSSAFLNLSDSSRSQQSVHVHNRAGRSVSVPERSGSDLSSCNFDEKDTTNNNNSNNKETVIPKSFAQRFRSLTYVIAASRIPVSRDSRSSFVEEEEF